MTEPIRSQIGGCVGKQRFESAQIAHSVARRRTSKHKPSSVYHCRFCGHFHICTTDSKLKRLVDKRPRA